MCTAVGACCEALYLLSCTSCCLHSAALVFFLLDGVRSRCVSIKL